MGGYGARAVSIDMTRGRTLTASTAATDQPFAPVRASASALTLSHQVVADRLSLAHWKPGHRIVVCSLAGGTGRTIMSGLVATVLSELPYRHIWGPIALTEPLPRTLSTSARRWGAPDSESHRSQDGTDGHLLRTPSGAHVLASPPADQSGTGYSVAVVDAPAGLPSDVGWVHADPNSSVLLISRPDVTSLTEVAEALVWMHDQLLVSRRRVTVVVNEGAGPADRGSKPALTALGIRCAAVHRLPHDPALAPGRPLPSGRAMPTRLRRSVARICLDIWTHAHTTGPASSGPDRQE